MRGYQTGQQYRKARIAKDKDDLIDTASDHAVTTGIGATVGLFVGGAIGKAIGNPKKGEQLGKAAGVAVGIVCAHLLKGSIEEGRSQRHKG